MASRKQEASVGQAALTAMDLGLKVAEIAVASGVVIGARMMLIGAAMRNPLSGDYRELSRMVPEKVFALAQSGIALFEQVSVAQREVAAQMLDSRSMIAGGMPTAAGMIELVSNAQQRGTRAALWPYATGVSALAPVHRTVTANAKRLRGSRRTAR